MATTEQLRMRVGQEYCRRMAHVERQRLARENRMLARQLAMMAAEIEHLHAQRRLDAMLLARERSLRHTIVEKLRRLTDGLVTRRPAVVIPLNRAVRPEAIPSFLRDDGDHMAGRGKAPRRLFPGLGTAGQPSARH